MRLIDADELEAAILEYGYEAIDAFELENEDKASIAVGIVADIKRIVDKTPTANVEKVKRGHWKMGKRKNLFKEYTDAIVCSECGGISQRGLKTKYCSRCGAEMEGMD